MPLALEHAGECGHVDVLVLVHLEGHVLLVGEGDEASGVVADAA
ncbi:hypothetical protein [Micromonospora chersina]